MTLLDSPKFPDESTCQFGDMPWSRMGSVRLQGQLHCDNWSLLVYLNSPTSKRDWNTQMFWVIQRHCKGDALRKSWHASVLYSSEYSQHSHACIPKRQRELYFSPLCYKISYIPNLAKPPTCTLFYFLEVGFLEDHPPKKVHFHTQQLLIHCLLLWHLSSTYLHGCFCPCLAPRSEFPFESFHLVPFLAGAATLPLRWWLVLSSCVMSNETSNVLDRETLGCLASIWAPILYDQKTCSSLKQFQLEFECWHCNREEWMREYPGRGVPGVLDRVLGSFPFRAVPSL